MRIGLIFPNKDRRYKTIHLGLAYLAAYARSMHEDLDIKVLDTRVASKSEVRNFFNKPFDLYGITVFSPVYHEVSDIFKLIRRKDQKAKICLGGPYVTTLMEEIFIQTPADFSVYGEGEITFSELIFFLKGKRKIDDIDGLMYLDDEGKSRKNRAREKITDLDNLPLPAYDLFPMKKYPLHRIVSSRGCNYACAWCNSSSIWDYSYRSFSPERVVKEIEFLLNNYGKKIFVFGDNNFNANLKWVEKICDLIIENEIKIMWSVSVRADNITDDVARKMKLAGCYNVAIGVESSNNDILNLMGKNTKIENITEGIRILKKAGIEVMSQYVIGSPYDTFETVKDTIEYAKSSGADYTNFYTVLPYKGTPQWKYVENHGRFFNRNIHEFHSIEPRIVFDTPEFTYDERKEIISIVKKEGFFSNKDKKSLMFDLTKDLSEKIQKLLPEKYARKIYIILKSIYKMKIVKDSI